MNSLTQALYNVESFREKVMQLGTVGNTIVTTLRTIFKAFDVNQNIRDAWYVDLKETDIFNKLGFVLMLKKIQEKYSRA